MADLVFDGVTFRRNLFGEWCEVSDEDGQLHIAWKESPCLDEIERLRAGVERLRAAGDAMAEALDALCHSYCGNDDDADLVDAWQEASRG